MNRYLLLYRSSTPVSEMMANATPEQAQEGMQAWMAWAQRTGEALTDMGAPLGAGRRVASGGAAEADSTVTGYSIIQAESEDAALDMLRDHPHLMAPGDNAVDVYPLVAPPGM